MMTYPFSTTNAWMARDSGNRDAEMTLICFPHAGAGRSAFRGWAEDSPDWLAIATVLLPGREGRISEAPITRMDQLSEAVSGAISRSFERPFAFFGHSMGALLAFDVTRELRRVGGPLPSHLFVSACPAPHLAHRGQKIHALPTPELVRQLRRLNGTPSEILSSPEMLDLVLPALRADFAAFETRTNVVDAPLDVPLTAFGARHDKSVTLDEIGEWRMHTRAQFKLLVFEGDHFFVFSNRLHVLREIASARDLT